MVKLEHFKPSEFKAYAKMDEGFLRYLDEVREVAGVAFFLTSDFRTADENAAAAGSSSASLHLTGNAVDFATVGSRARMAQEFYKDCWAIARACAFVVRPRNVQLEFVKGPTDWHVHLGLYPAGDVRPSRLIVTAE